LEAHGKARALRPVLFLLGMKEQPWVLVGVLTGMGYGLLGDDGSVGGPALVEAQ
jgi:hypothetical protein